MKQACLLNTNEHERSQVSLIRPLKTNFVWMKNIKVCVILLFSYSIIAWTQEPLIEFTPKRKAEIQTLWMQKKFNLDSVSTSKVYQTNLEYQRELDSLLAASAPSTTIISLQTKREYELKKNLNHQQYDDYIAWKKMIQKVKIRNQK